MKRSLGLIGLFTLTLTLSGCFGGGGESANPSANASASGPAVTNSPTSTEPPMEASNVFVDVDNSQGEGDYIGALSDVVTSSCEADGATWVGSGTVVNSSDARVDYRIWVSFLDPDGETLGLVQSNVDGIRGGNSGDFSAAMPYSGTDALTCVLRVERRDAN